MRMCVQFSRGSQVALVVKNPPANAWVLRAWVWSLGQEDPLEEDTATLQYPRLENPHRQQSLVRCSP